MPRFRLGWGRFLSGRREGFPGSRGDRLPKVSKSFDFVVVVVDQNILIVQSLVHTPQQVTSVPAIQAFHLQGGKRTRGPSHFSSPTRSCLHNGRAHRRDRKLS